MGQIGGEGECGRLFRVIPDPADGGELRQFTNRFLNKIKSVGGFVFYVGIHKRYSPESHDANKLYLSVLREAIKRLDQHCANPNSPNVSCHSS